MVPLSTLWLPILLSAVGVFAASSIIHMLLGYHKTDFIGLPDEEGARSALGGLNLPPGDYVLPHCSGTAEMKSPEYKAKCAAGPNIFMTVLPAGVPGMGLSLGLWFLNAVLISIFAAYIAGLALGPGAYYLSVFRFIGTTAFMGYSFAHLSNSIWYKKSWSATIKNIFDGLVYALISAGVFGWLWPA